MPNSKKSALIPGRLVTCMFFIAYFLYFAVFNRYLLIYQEQIQLFRFDWNYFTGFLSKPGGVVEFLGAFFIQFYLSPVAAVSIVTLAGIAAYTLAGYIFRKYNAHGILWSFIPVLFLAALQSDYKYELGYTIGYLLVLGFFALYISLRNDSFRYATGFIGWFFLYLITGGLSLPVTILFIIHELLFTKTRYRLVAALGYALISVLLPYLAWRYIYFIPISGVWLNHILFPYNGATKYALLLLLAYLPLSLIMIKIWYVLSKKDQLLFDWDIRTIAFGIIILFAFSWAIKKYFYDLKNELLFKIDDSVQHEKWDQVLKISSQYPGNNRIVLYYTNLALYKSGQMGDHLFSYNQLDVSSLWLEWPGNKFSLFFGSEIFYHLGYINEAYRWAFDAMVTSGESPRLMKQLAKISFINGNNSIAEKYLNIIGKTLFYRKWARHYKNYLYDSGLLLHDREIVEKQHLSIQTNFIVDTNYPEYVSGKLLENHPDNRMAFEYYMASLLLDKKITTFAANIYRIKDYGYKEIPVNYEEALLVYMYISKNNIVPEGYIIRNATIKRFTDYSNAFSQYAANPDLAAKNLYQSYGNTYWFYLHFINTKVKIR